MHSLHRFLVDYDIAMLRTLAQNRGVALATNRQTEAADQLAITLLDPLSVRSALASLSPQGRETLEALLATGGRMRAPHFARRFGQVRPIGPGRLEREALWQNPANPAEELWYAGLIFRAFTDDEGGPGEFIFVPDDLLPLLPQPRDKRPAFAVETVAAPPHPGDGASDLAKDMFAYLVYLQTHDVRPYADGRLGRRSLATLRGRLMDPGERRLIFLRHLAAQLGFVVRQDEYLRLDATLTKRWLIASPERQLAVLQEAWRDDPTWNDLCSVPGLVCDQETGWHLRYDPVATRRAFLALLARCPLDTWWSLASFVEAMKETHPDFQRPDGDYASWYIRDAESGTYLSGFESWDRVEGVLIADLLAGPLRWLGVVTTAKDEARERSDQHAVCRLTDAGARFLGLMPGAPESPPSRPIIVRPDFSVTVPAPANLYTRFQLERFADLESKDPCRYSLTLGALARALAREIRVDQVLAFLQQASETPVPANVAGQLRLWAGRLGQIQLEEVALLTVKNERVLRELSVLPETRSLVGQVLSPTTALIQKANLPRLRRALRALGYLPPSLTDSASDPTERG
jgi:hypothetical protein